MTDQLSYRAMPRKVFPPYVTLIDLLGQQVDQNPDKDAFVFRFDERGRQSVTFKEVYDRSRSFASALLSIGFERGDSIVNTLPNCAASVYVQIGAWFVGVVPVNILIRKRDPSALIDVFRHSKCKAIVLGDHDEDQWNLITEITGKSINGEVKCTAAPSLKYVISATKPRDGSEMFSVEEFIQGPTDESVMFPGVFPEDFAMIIQTSGSTGVPKLVARSHFTFIGIVDEFCDVGKITESAYYNDRHFGWISATIIPTLITGCTRVCFDNTKTLSPADACTFFRIIEEENCVVALCLPFIFPSIMKADPLPTKPPTLKVLHSGGVPLSCTVVERLREYADHLIYFYGMTEVGVCAYFASDDNSAYVTAIAGKPVGGGEVKVVDEHGRVVKRGTRGEIYLRNTFLFEEYYCDDERTKSAFGPGKWLKTGDTGYMDTNGILFCEGRVGEAIYPGKTIYPIEVEAPMKKMEIVEDVAAVAVPGDAHAEEVCACVIARSPDVTVADLMKMSKSVFYVHEHVRSSLCPRYIIIMKEFPRTTNGKIDRRALSDVASAQLKLNR